MLEVVGGAVTEAVFGYALEQAGIGDKIRTLLKRDPQRLAFQVAFTRAYSAFSSRYPQWTSDLFDEHFLTQSAAPLLAQCLLRNQRPAGSELAAAWASHFGLEGDVRATRLLEVTHVADDFLALLDAELRTRDEFQPLFDSRALDAIVGATAQTADSAAEIALQLARLRTELQTLLSQEEVSGRVQAGNLPPMPQLIIGRDSDLARLKQHIGITSDDITSNIQQTRPLNVLTAMRGWPGVGKTTLAAALAHDDEVAARFPDGVLWASLGQKPNLFGELAKWGRLLGIPDLHGAKTVEEASQQLTAVLRNKRALLIVDDVWEAAHLQPFMVASADCALLVTTRLPEVARNITATPNDVYVLGVLGLEDALLLLRALSPKVVVENEEACKELVKDLEGLPLALQVAGRLLQAETSYGFGVTDLLRDLHAGAKLIEAQAPANRSDIANQTTPTVAALLELSTNRLDEISLLHFAYLGAFAPKPATFDLAAIKSVWEIDDPKPILRILIDRGLLELVDQRYWMHAILVAHARSFWAEETP